MNKRARLTSCPLLLKSKLDLSVLMKIEESFQILPLSTNVIGARSISLLEEISPREAVCAIEEFCNRYRWAAHKMRDYSGYFRGVCKKYWKLNREAEKKNLIASKDTVDKASLISNTVDVLFTNASGLSKDLVDAQKRALLLKFNYVDAVEALYEFCNAAMYREHKIRSMHAYLLNIIKRREANPTILAPEDEQPGDPQPHQSKTQFQNSRYHNSNSSSHNSGGGKRSHGREGGGRQQHGRQKNSSRRGSKRNSGSSSGRSSASSSRGTPTSNPSPRKRSPAAAAASIARPEPAQAPLSPAPAVTPLLEDEDALVDVLTLQQTTPPPDVEAPSFTSLEPLPPSPVTTSEVPPPTPIVEPEPDPSCPSLPECDPESENRRPSPTRAMPAPPSAQLPSAPSSLGQPPSKPGGFIHEPMKPKPCDEGGAQAKNTRPVSAAPRRSNHQQQANPHPQQKNHLDRNDHRQNGFHQNYHRPNHHHHPLHTRGHRHHPNFHNNNFNNPNRPYNRHHNQRRHPNFGGGRRFQRGSHQPRHFHRERIRSDGPFSSLQANCTPRILDPRFAGLIAGL